MIVGSVAGENDADSPRIFGRESTALPIFLFHFMYVCMFPVTKNMRCAPPNRPPQPDVSDVTLMHRVMLGVPLLCDRAFAEVKSRVRFRFDPTRVTRTGVGKKNNIYLQQKPRE